MIEIIKKSELDYALDNEYRQYLTGHLSLPQKFLKHIDGDIEIGVSHYRQFTADKPHVHPVATEYTYVFQGAVRVRLLSDFDTEYEFHEGDFFAIQPGSPYLSKHFADTKVLFIKSPGLNDKKLVDIDEKMKVWLSAWDVAL